MTKQELLQQLATKFYKVGTIENAEQSEKGQVKREQEGVIWYLIGVYEKQGDVLIRRNVPVYCEITGEYIRDMGRVLTFDELPAGNYFFGEKMPEEHILPQPTPESPFKNIEGEIERQGKDYALVRRFVIENGVAVEKKFLVKIEGEKLSEYPIQETTAREII